MASVQFLWSWQYQQYHGTEDYTVSGRQEISPAAVYASLSLSPRYVKNLEIVDEQTALRDSIPSLGI